MLNVVEKNTNQCLLESYLEGFNSSMKRFHLERSGAQIHINDFLPRI